MTETEIIEKIQLGDNQAFDELVVQYLPLVYRYLIRLTNDVTLAEDLAQEAFVRAWQSIKHFDSSRPFRPWLLNIARNAAFDVLRRKKVAPFSSLSTSEQLGVISIADQSLTPKEAAEQNETTSFVKNILDRLSATEKEVLVLHYLEELKVSEIATILNLPLETIRTRLRRAREAFRQTSTHAFEPSLAPSYVLESKGDHEAKTTQSVTPLSPDPLDS